MFSRWHCFSFVFLWERSENVTWVKCTFLRPGTFVPESCQMDFHQQWRLFDGMFTTSEAIILLCITHTGLFSGSFVYSHYSHKCLFTPNSQMDLLCISPQLLSNGMQRGRVCVCVCVCVCVFLCVWISCHPLTALTRDSGSLSRFPPSLLSVLYMKWSTFPLQLQLAVNIAGQKTRDTGGLLLLRPGWQAGVKRNPFFFNRQKLKSHLWAQLLSVNSSGSEMSLMWGSDSKEIITDISRSLYYNFWDIFRIKHLYQLDAHLFCFFCFFLCTGYSLTICIIMHTTRLSPPVNQSLA